MNVINILKKIINSCKYKNLLSKPIDQTTITLIESCMKLFPDTIDFSDGELRDDNGFFSNNLSKVWNNADAQNISKNVNTDFMIWSIYGVLHKKSRDLFEMGVYMFNVNELDYNDINTEYIRVCLESEIPME